MQVADLVALVALRFNGLCDGAERRAPGYHQQVAFLDRQRERVGTSCTMAWIFAARIRPSSRGSWLVIDVAGDVLFLQTADAMFEAGSSGNGPGTRQGIRVALVRKIGRRIGCIFHRNSGNFVDVGNAARVRRHWPDSRRKE